MRSTPAASAGVLQAAEQMRKASARWRRQGRRRSAIKPSQASGEERVEASHELPAMLVGTGDFVKPAQEFFALQQPEFCRTSREVDSTRF